MATSSDKPRLLRVAYLNPYLARAEEQAFRSLQDAARAANVELVARLPTELCEDDDFDFVISTASDIRKTTSHPLYLSAHLPRSAYVETSEIWSSTCSYDGYLCIADNLIEFFGHLSASRGLPVSQPGFYYNAPQVLDLVAPLEQIVAEGKLSLCYFGTNWEPRATRLFRRLAQRPYMRMYGPSASWSTIEPSSYRGAVPFDGWSVQAEYAAFGVGLVSLAFDHLVDDVVSNRVFEIISVGACAICPDTPWIRENFEDSVFYYGAFEEPDAILAQIDAAMGSIEANPAAATAMAAEARRRFEGRFDAATLLRNAVSFHEKWRIERDRRCTPWDEIIVDVIIRVGGRSVDTVRRAVQSLERQVTGRYRIIFVAHSPINLASILSDRYSRIVAFDIVDAPGANRSVALGAGLDALSADLFAVLDDDDYLLNHHFLGLFSALFTTPSQRRFAYSDVLRWAPGENGGFSLSKEGPAAGDIYALMQRFTSHCFLASRNCLEGLDRSRWDLETAEDILLICALLRTATPSHSPSATAVYVQGEDEASGFLSNPRRRRDELALYTEVAPWRGVIEQRFAPCPPDSLAFIAPRVRAVMQEARDRQSRGGGGALISSCVEISPARIDRRPGALDGRVLYGGRFVDEDVMFIGLPQFLGRIRGLSAGVRPDGSIRVGPASAWTIPLVVDIADYQLPGCTTIALLTFDGATSGLWVGLTQAEGEPIARTQVPPSSKVLAALVRGPSGAPLPRVLLQAGPSGLEGEVSVWRLHVGYLASELADALAWGEPRPPTAELAHRLESRLARFSFGERTVSPVQGVSINVRTARSAFSYPVEDGPFSEGVYRMVSTGRTPWDYFGRVYIPGSSNRHDIRVLLGDVREALRLFLVDERFQETLSPVAEIPAGKQEVEVWLATETGQPAYLVFQCTDAPQEGALTIRSIESFTQTVASP